MQHLPDHFVQFINKCIQNQPTFIQRGNVTDVAEQLIGRLAYNFLITFHNGTPSIY